MTDAGVEAARKEAQEIVQAAFNEDDECVCIDRLMTWLAAHTAAALVADRMERHEEFVEILARRITHAADLTARLAAAEELNFHNGNWIAMAEPEIARLTAAVAQAQEIIRKMTNMEFQSVAEFKDALAALTPPPGGR